MRRTYWIMILFALFMVVCGPAFAEEGYDYEDGSDINIEEGDSSKEGSEIDVFNEDTGTFDTETVESSSSGEVDTFDEDTGQFHTYETED